MDPVLRTNTMTVKHLWLTDFRNHREIDLSLDPGVTVVVAASSIVVDTTSADGGTPPSVSASVEPQADSMSTALRTSAAPRR